MITQHPEDFMDDEDFGEFGIAPRRIKLSSTFDDSHLRDTLKAAIGGQSVIPGAGSIIKNLIVPSKGPLAQRLLRKMGWRESQLELADDAVEHEPSPLTSTFDAPELTVPVVYYTKIDFEGKNNTFGLGYSGLDPNIAMGRRQFASDKSFRHPEESSSALVERQSSLQRGFVPLEGPARAGIRGQAFGVGVLELDDPDVYDTDRLADYDWEIGGNATDEEASDDEESELEAARLGRWSGSDKQKGKSVGHKTLDGWTAPSRRTASHPSADASKRSTFPGFVVGSVLTGADRYAGDSEPVRIPPGYIPVFNPKCVRDPNSSEDPSVELSAQLPARKPFDRKSDVLFRSQTLEQAMDGR
ncbi:unnamed protein product [Dicrocoelium dendriticum]|nr:unnamed protein product [Dicrocoelium dendriticum]